MPLLQLLNDTVADVYLIVEILPLEVEDLEVERRADTAIHHVQRLIVEHRRVERTDDVEADVRGISGLHIYMYSLQQVVDDVAVGVHTLDDLVEDSALAHTIDTAQDIHLPVQFPHHVFLPAPERVDLYPPDIVSILLHSRRFLWGKNTQKNRKFKTFGLLFVQNLSTFKLSRLFARVPERLQSDIEDQVAISRNRGLRRSAIALLIGKVNAPTVSRMHVHQSGSHT